MKKRLISGLLALLMLLTMLPMGVSAAAQDALAGTQPQLYLAPLYLYSDTVWKESSEWINVEQDALPDSVYGGWGVFYYGDAEDKASAVRVTEISSTNARLYLETPGQDDLAESLAAIEGCRYFQAYDPGQETLTFTVNGEAHTAVCTVPARPWGSFTSDTMDEAQYADYLPYTGEEDVSFRMLSETGLPTDAALSVQLQEGETTRSLTAAEDGWYGFAGHEKFVHLETITDAKGQRGLKVTIPQGQRLPELPELFTLRVEGRGDEDSFGWDTGIQNLAGGEGLWFAPVVQTGSGWQESEQWFAVDESVLPEAGSSCFGVFYYGSREDKASAVRLESVKGDETLLRVAAINGEDYFAYGDGRLDIPNLHYLFSLRPGQATLTYTANGTEQTAASDIRLPEAGAFTENQYLAAAFIPGGTLPTYDASSDLTYWYLGKTGISAASVQPVLEYNGISTPLTASADGWYDFGSHERFVRIQMTADARGLPALCVTIPQGQSLPEFTGGTFFLRLLMLDAEGNACGEHNQTVSYQGDQLWSQWTYYNGAQWTDDNEYFNVVSIPAYVLPQDANFCRFRFGRSADQTVAVVSVSSKSGCLSVRKVTENGADGDNIFKLQAANVGSDTLHFTLSDGTEFDYPIEISLPQSWFYSAGRVSQETLRSRIVLCDGNEQTLWLLCQTCLEEFLKLDLTLDGETTTLTAGGTFELPGYGKLSLDWAALEDGSGYGLKLTLPATADLSQFIAQTLYLTVYARTSDNEAFNYSASLTLKPDNHLWMARVRRVSNGDGTYAWSADLNSLTDTLTFDLTGPNSAGSYAFYYRETEDSDPVPVDSIAIPGGAVAISSPLADNTAAPAKNMVLLSTLKTGTYPLTATVGSKTYTQPIRIQLPSWAFFTAPSYSEEAYLPGNLVNRSASDAAPLTLWLLAKSTFPADVTLKLYSGSNTLSVGDDGYVTIGDFSKILHLTREPLSGGGYGIRLAFADGKALNALLAKEGSLPLYLEVSSAEGYYLGASNLWIQYQAPHGPQPGAYSGSTDPGADVPADSTSRPEPAPIHVSYNGVEYVIPLGIFSGNNSGSITSVEGGFGQMFSVDAVEHGIYSEHTLAITVFENYASASQRERPELVSRLISSVAFRITTTKNPGCITWDDLTLPSEGDPRYRLRIAYAPMADGYGYLSADITLKDGVTILTQTDNDSWTADETAARKQTITSSFWTDVDKTLVIDCAAGYNGSGPIDTMDALNSFLQTLDPGEHTNIEIHLMPIAYEGILEYDPQSPLMRNAVLCGSQDPQTGAYTTIYGGILLKKNLSMIQSLYLTPNPDDSKNLKDRTGTSTVGLRCDGGEALIVTNTCFDGYGIGLVGDEGGTVSPTRCVFKNCTTGVLLDCAARTSGNKNPSWFRNTFFRCQTALDLRSLPQYITPYLFRVYDSNFLSNGVDIQVPADFTSTYYFYRNYFGTLEGALTAPHLSDAEARDSIVRAGTEDAPTVLVNPRRKYALLATGSGPTLCGTEPAPAPHTEDSASSASQARVLRAARAARSVQSEILTVESSHAVRILNGEADLNQISDPVAFYNLQNPLAVDVIEQAESNILTLGVWTFAAGLTAQNDGFHAGLEIQNNSDGSLTVTVQDAGCLAALCPTLTIPCPQGWENAAVQAPDGTSLFASWQDGTESSVTFPVAAGGSYTIRQAARLWISDPQVKGDAVEASLDFQIFPALDGKTVVLALYRADGRLLTTAVQSVHPSGAAPAATPFRASFSASVLQQAETLKFLVLDPTTGKPAYAACTWPRASLQS